MTYKIPYAFIRDRAELCWGEIKYGLQHQIIAPQVAVEKANAELGEDGHTGPVELELVTCTNPEAINEQVAKLAATEKPIEETAVRAKWLYLVLAWLFECKESFAEPLAVVEQVYSDFGYPKDIAAFVRYMPMQGPDLGNAEQNEARLYRRWEDYVRNATNRFLPAQKHG